MFKPYLITTNHQKVLAYFIDHPGQSVYGLELAKKIKLSTSGVNSVLRELQRADILKKISKGKTDLYSLKDNQPIVGQLKILHVLLKLESLVEELKPLTHRIIFYGSSSRGTNDQQSDIDLLIVTPNNNKEQVEEKIRNFQEREAELPKIQASIKNTVQWANLEEKDPIYFNEVLRGIILWESLSSYE